MASNAAAFTRLSSSAIGNVLNHRAVRLAGLVVLVWPLAIIMHQGLLFGLSSLCAIFLGVGEPAARLPGDEIYNGLALSMLGSLRPVGVALSNGMQVLFEAGSSATGLQVVQVALNTSLIAFGTAATILSLARPRPTRVRRWLPYLPLHAAAVAILICGVGAEMHLSWARGSGGEMAASMVATKILHLEAGAYDAALSYDDLWSAALNVSIVLLAAAPGAAVAFGLGRLLRRARWVRMAVPRIQLRKPSWRMAPLAAAAGLVLVPFQQAATFEQLMQPAAAMNSGMVQAAVGLDGVRAPGSDMLGLNGPSQVTIKNVDGAYDYRVNGQTDFIRGIGYNPITQSLSVERRTAILDRDFALMAAADANTVTGWSEAEFDDVLMASAAGHGLGVILPIELQYSRLYVDPHVQEEFLGHIVARVLQHKDDPALRMWGLGNEILHDRMISKLKPEPFAQFLVQAADTIHALDPNHLVIYRDAEDVFVGPLATALKANPAQRPWFVYGMNFFTPRMNEVLTKGPAVALDQPLLISEFGPAGLRAADRPGGYAKLWNVILGHRGLVLGGCAYVWSTAGPEALDRGFGLTDETGQPVDNSMSALAGLFASERTRARARATGLLDS